MNRSVAQLIACALALLAGACQPHTQTKIVTVAVAERPPQTSTELVDFKKETVGTPLPVPAFDPSCQTEPLDSSILEAVETIWYGYQDTDEQTVAMTTTVINSRTFEREVTSKTDLRFTVQSEKKPLGFCKTASKADSMQSISAQLLQSLVQSHRFYKNLQELPSNKAWPVLPPLGLGLFPTYNKIEKRIEKLIKADQSTSQTATQRISVDTDNAFYSPFADETLSDSIYAVSIIPQSIEARNDGLFDGKGLWEYPVVFHHEYGHHVFQFLFGDSTVLSVRDYMQYWQKHRQLHAIINLPSELDRVRDSHEEKQYRAFLSSPGYVFGALNEGFADLFAYYSLKQPPRLFDITCFRETREVSSPLMYGGIVKAWSDEIWNETFDLNVRIGADKNPGKKLSPIEQCSIPSFDDIHIVGAVIAHTVDAVFETIVQSRPEQSAVDLKTQLLIDWILTLRASDEVLELSSKQSLSRILNSALGIAAQELQTADRTLFCSTIRSKFAAPRKRWLSKPAEDTAGIMAVCPEPAVAAAESPSN